MQILISQKFGGGAQPIGGETITPYAPIIATVLGDENTNSWGFILQAPMIATALKW